MTGDATDDQLATIARAVDLGIDYFDTAATYGGGRSESALGAALKTLGLTERVRIATKVRLMSEDRDDIGRAVRESFEASCARLGVERVTLLQLHNSITHARDDLPTSITIQDVLGRDGVVAALEALRREGRVEHFGFTGLGDMQSVSQIVKDGPFVSAQIPLNILLPMSGADASAGSVDVDYMELVRICHQYKVGVIGIRVFAGGALVGQEPSPHTYKTKFFTLDVFQRDRIRAATLAELLPADISPVAASVRYVTHNLQTTTAAIGFATPQQVEQAAALSNDGPLDPALVQRIHDAGDPCAAKDGD